MLAHNHSSKPLSYVGFSCLLASAIFAAMASPDTPVINPSFPKHDPISPVKRRQMADVAPGKGMRAYMSSTWNNLLISRDVNFCTRAVQSVAEVFREKFSVTNTRLFAIEVDAVPWPLWSDKTIDTFSRWKIKPIEIWPDGFPLPPPHTVVTDDGFSSPSPVVVAGATQPQQLMVSVNFALLCCLSCVCTCIFGSSVNDRRMGVALVRIWFATTSFCEDACLRMHLHTNKPPFVDESLDTCVCSCECDEEFVVAFLVHS